MKYEKLHKVTGTQLLAKHRKRSPVFMKNAPRAASV